MERNLIIMIWVALSIFFWALNTFSLLLTVENLTKGQTVAFICIQRTDKRAEMP